MAAMVGRTIGVYWGDESPQPLVAGVRDKGITLNGEPVDVTSDDSNGWRELLDVPQMSSVDITCSGVLKNGDLRADWFTGHSTPGNRTQALTLMYPDGATVSGVFVLQAYSETGVHDGEVTFEATFQSTGAVVYTPAA